MKLEIRRANPQDEEKLFNILLAQASEDEFTLLSSDEGKGLLRNSREQWKLNLTPQGRFFYLVAIINDEIVGFCDVHQGTTSRSKHIVEFGRYVAPEWRRKQVGRQLQNEALKWAKSQSEIKIIKVVITAANKASMASSLSNGFKEQYRMKDEIRLKDGQYSDLVCLTYQPSL